MGLRLRAVPVSGNRGWSTWAETAEELGGNSRCVRKDPFSELRKEMPWLWFRLNAHETQLARAEGPGSRSLIRACHRSNEYHLNCFVYWWSLDVDLICARV